MRKIIALLCAVCICAMLVIPAGAVTASVENYFLIDILYTATDGSAVSQIPNTAPSFDVVADPSNPDSSKRIAINEVESVDSGYLLSVYYPSFDSVGVYQYTITQREGDGQGVTYFTEPITIEIIAYYADDEHTEIDVSVLAYIGEDKTSSITNFYDLAELTVTNQVTGNMGSFEDAFAVDVIFSVEEGKTVQSDITYVFDSTETITAEALNAEPQTVTLNLKSGQSVRFSNIPYGVTYVVEEQDYTDLGYSAPVYSVNGTALEDICASGTIDANTVAVEITNHYEVEIPTGISLDSVPYIVILGVVAVGLAVVLLKKKVHYAD